VIAVAYHVSDLSGLTKKAVYTDKLLATIAGVTEGDRVSYADLTRGLHRYIRDHNLKSPEFAAAVPSPTTPQAAPTQPQITPTGPTGTCRECGTEIPAEAIFCDLCGARQ